MKRKRIVKSIAEYCVKGNPIGVKGRLQARSYVYEDVKRTANELIAEKVRFLSYNRSKDKEDEE